MAPALMPLDPYPSLCRYGIRLVARLRDVLPGQVAIGLTGRDPDGNRLAAGPYRIKLVAVPTTGRPITRKVVKFRIK